MGRTGTLTLQGISRLPTNKTRRLLGVLGAVGIITFCSGCGFFINNQISLARTLLIVANVVLIPLFMYLVIMRSRASAQYKRRMKKQEAQAQKELAALSAVDTLLKQGKAPAPGEEPPGPDPTTQKASGEYQP